MGRIGTVLFVGLSVLATIWVYNRFSKKNIATLGAPTA